MEPTLLKNIREGDPRALTRAISYVENETGNYRELLESLPFSKKKIIGITGPPGAGKSTLVNALLEELTGQEKTTGILCIDPSSPFHGGALLGDRIRMNQWQNNPSVFIRSLATRGSMGGLNPKIIEITDLMRAAPFDQVIIETVGVGQSEVEIAGLADTTIVVLVPEGGDEIQAMKAGLMEIADIFVVNKADRPGADLFIKNLRSMLPVPTHPDAPGIPVMEIPVLKTVATQKEGITQLIEAIALHQKMDGSPEKKYWLLAEKAYQLVQGKRMRDISKQVLLELVKKEMEEGDFNLYRFIDQLSAH
jgi:LAO/AO transport system kinase